jgi:hypothetical protein
MFGRNAPTSTCYFLILTTNFGSFTVATFDRSGLTVVTSVEEPAAGRYRGFLTIDTEARASGATTASRVESHLFKRVPNAT